MAVLKLRVQMRLAIGVVCALTWLASWGASWSGAQGSKPDSLSAGAPAMVVTLRPGAADAGGHVHSVEITLLVSGLAADAHQRLLEMPLVTSNVETVAAAVDGLSASDDRGSLPLTFEDEQAPSQTRHWLPTRSISGPVTVHYRAPITEVLAPRGAAPPLELRSDHGTFSGAGETFLMLPEASFTAKRLPLRVGVRWDMSGMAAGAVGVSSFGVGNVDSKTMTGVESLKGSFFMGGNVHVYPAGPEPVGFFAAWYGAPPFDLLPVMSSEQKLYKFYEEFFKRPSTAPYGVFVRENLVNAGGGVSLGNNSFVTTFGPKTDLDELKITLAHEMLHTFAGALDAPAGIESSWYSEGLAVYYARLLAMRAGQITPAQFLEDLNTTAGRYYTDAFLGTPNSEVAANFWADTRIRVLPYDRGSMYFAVLDGELRTSSKGKHTLDDLLLAMLDRKKQNLRVDKAAWIDLVKTYLGDKGEVEFEAMMGGALMLPEPEGFGPCFTRVTKPMRRYQLGFEPRVLIEHKRIVRGLIAGSNAAVAGVRDGDEITKPVPQDLLQGEQDGILTLELLRDGKPLKISYLPRGETVDAYQWVRKSGLTDSACVY